MRIAVLCPHLRIAGGVRAVLAYADRLAGRRHDVRLLVPDRAGWRPWRRQWPGAAPDWMPGLRASVERVRRWNPARLPDADALIATAWQSARAVADAPARCGRKLYLIQHYESLYHGQPAVADATYRLPLRKIAISTWLAGIMRDRFGEEATVIVTPVDTSLFRPVPGRARGGELDEGGRRDAPWPRRVQLLLQRAVVEAQRAGRRVQAVLPRQRHGGRPERRRHRRPAMRPSFTPARDPPPRVL